MEIKRWNLAHSAVMLAACPVCLALNSSLPLLMTLLGSLAWLSFGQYLKDSVELLTLANLITVGRLALLAVPLYTGQSLEVLGLGLILFLVLDGVDGYAARKLGQTTHFGSVLDMEVDAAGIYLLTLHLAVLDPSAAWLILPGSLRYVFVWFRQLVCPTWQAEPRRRWGRAVFVVFVISLIIYLLFHPKLPLVAMVGTLALSLSFAVDFVGVWRGRLADQGASFPRRQ